MFTLPKLSFELTALEPTIDARTMEIHHGKHHQGYVDKLNAAVANTPEAELSLEELLSSVSEHSSAVRNNAGGHFNHSLFWRVITPGGAAQPSVELLTALERDFGSFEAFKQAFETAATTQFGSGWAWLTMDGGTLKVGSTANQDNPLMDVAELSGTPLLGLDVWEHAYYLQYQNRRPEYVSNFWQIVNWDVVSGMFAAAQQ
jgi:superoxide dismutase, Fe-Mn family